MASFYYISDPPILSIEQQRTMAATKNPGIKLSALAPSIALGVMQTGAAVSLAALVFAGDASDGLARATITFLIGSVAACVISAWRTSFEVIVAGAKNNVAVVIASIAAGVAATSGPGQAGTTVAVFVVLASLASGVLMYTLGRLHLGELARFIPYPVVGGYLAGTAWLMVKGGVQVMVDERLGLGELDDLATWDLAKFWLPGLGLALAIVLLPGANRQSITIAAALAGFHLIVPFVSSHERVQEQGWVLGPFSEGVGLAAVGIDLDEVDWGAITSSMLGIGAIALMSVVALLLNVTGVEQASGEEVDIDQELRAAGLSSTAAGAVGGPVGFIGLGQTLLARRMTASSSLVAAAFVAMAMITAIAGPSLVGWMPRFVSGALIMGPGVVLLRRWVAESLLSGPKHDRLIAVLIPLTVALFGILQGVGLGIIVAAALFVLRYASIDPVRLQTDGSALRSSIDRSTEATRQLDLHGNKIVVLRLEGFLFFGSAAKLTRRVREVVKGEASHLIVDFDRLKGFDSSAKAELAKIGGLCEANHVRLYVSAMPWELLATLPGGIATDLDHALEAAEHSLLGDDIDAAIQLPEPDLPVDRLILSYFTELAIPAGTVVLTAGEPADAILLIESGSLTVTADHELAGRRLRRITAGAFVGEMGFFTGESRSATVTADVDSVMFRMSREDFSRLAAAHPDKALAMVQKVLAVTSQRLAASNALVRDLLR